MLKTIFSGLKYGTSEIKGLVLTQFLAKTTAELTPLLFSIIWAKLIDTAIIGVGNNNISFSLLLIPFLLYVLVELIKSVSTRLNDYWEARVFDFLETKLHVDIIKKYSSLDIQSLEDPEVNRLFQVIRESYEWRIRNLIFEFESLLSTFILMLFASFVLFQISPLVTFIIIVSAIPSVFINIRFGSISWGIWHDDANNFRKFNLTKDFLLSKENLIEASVNNIAPHLVTVIKDILDGYHNKRKPIIKRNALVTILSDLIRILSSVLSVYLLINMALVGQISIGNLVLGASVFVSFSSSFGSFLYHFTETYNSGNYMKDFLAFMKLKSNKKTGSIILAKATNPPKIEFKNVSFSYPNTSRMILKDIDLLIEPGMKVALVGENGVGKTTLIKLLAHFYDLNSGEILIDDKNLVNLEKESWEQNLGLLTQHFNTYPAFSLKENIYFGDVSREIKESEIIESAEKANVLGFSKHFKDGLDQILSVQFEGGIDPSWGQWQRIGIARTLYRNPSIIILDEPTSAIDAQAEYEIFQNINKQTEGKTVIYVSHRYSTVRNADLICVLKDGCIVESGTHKELIAKNGEYAKNFSLQAEGYN